MQHFCSLVIIIFHHNHHPPQMAATLSRMMPLGTTAPDFTLPDTVSGAMLSLEHIRINNADATKSANIVMFLCNHCPYVLHIQQALVRLVSEYKDKNVAFVAISSNDAGAYPDDAPMQMTLHARQHQYSFPYLYDETQNVARAYDAACTPDFFVFGADLRCVYRGQFDDSRPNNDILPSGNDLKAALDAVLAGLPVNPMQKPSIGCSIKWKA
jgi:thiol-disulfide isomerase/thioredoxin